jgi:uncharacterized protein (DUF1684 family)
MKGHSVSMPEDCRDVRKEGNVMVTTYEALADYRRRVAALYADVRHSTLELAETCRRFRQERDELFRAHPQSALSEEQKTAFTGLNYYPYDPVFRFVLPVDTNVEPSIQDIPLQDDGVVHIKRFGKIHFRVGDEPVSLSVYWILGYGGGIFLPFHDLTSGHETYGGGRYLLDTIKHADLGEQDGKLVIDFNYAYNPSCAYNARWHCPLAPRENWLPVALPVGEQRYDC